MLMLRKSMIWGCVSVTREQVPNKQSMKWKYAAACLLLLLQLQCGLALQRIWSQLKWSSMQCTMHMAYCIICMNLASYCTKLQWTLLHSKCATRALIAGNWIHRRCLFTPPPSLSLSAFSYRFIIILFISTAIPIIRFQVWVENSGT